MTPEQKQNQVELDEQKVSAMPNALDEQSEAKLDEESRELSDNELDNVAGGEGASFILPGM